MIPCVLFLRGVNVGGRNRLPMADFVAVLETSGFTDIRTCIQSGNAVCKCDHEPGPEDTRRIARAILEARGFEPRVFLLGEEKFLAVMEANPFPTGDGRAVHVYFLERSPAREEMSSLDGVRADSERMILGDGVLYLYAPDGIGRSKLAASVEHHLGMLVTARNWNTLVRVAGLLPDGLPSSGGPGV